MKSLVIFSCLLTGGPLLALAAIGAGNTRDIDIKMPFSHPEQPETYLCTPTKLDPNNTNYIVGFHPLAEAKTAHHMLLYGCETPGRADPIFNCGSMAMKQAGLNSALRPCGRGHSEIVYAWAQNAPELKLPEDVAFRVGGDSRVQYLVLQVHYASVDYIPEDGDESGVTLKYTNVPQPKTAGVYFSGTNGRIPSASTTHMEASCTLKEDLVLHPFAFRVHTHRLGRVVSGWKVQGANRWTLLGKEDPQLPQMFYPTVNNVTTLAKGDTFAARCTMVNYRDHAVWVGATREDEMCNFYLMYWVDGSKTLNKNQCYSVGPPIYSWGGWLIGGGLSNIPEDEASSL